LGLNSQIVKDQHLGAAFVTAWFITLANMLYTKAFVLSTSFVSVYITAAAGSSIGICCSILVYTNYFIRRRKSQKNMEIEER
jgi:hypothetical protein